MVTYMTNMSVAAAIRARRSVRHYQPTIVPTSDLEALLALAVEAPSSWNLQDRSIVAVTSEGGLADLAAASGGQPQAQEAPLVLVFVAEPSAWRDDHADVYEQARSSGAWNEEFIALFRAEAPRFQENLEEVGLLREYAVKDAMIAATYVMLAAIEMGLDTSPMNGWDETLVKKAIGIGDRDDLAIALLVAVGYSAEVRVHPGRRQVERNAFRQVYGQCT